MTATRPSAAPAPGRLARRLPITSWIRRYDPRRAGGDVLAGVVVAALAVPQSLGYATIAGVPVQVGLYTLPLALVAYAALGTSRLLFVGPVSTVSVLSGSLVVGMTGGADDPARAMALTAGLAIATGLVLLVAGLFRLGWAAEFLSKPIVTGFVFGLVILIVIGELPALLGLPKEGGDVLARAWTLATHLGDLDPLTAVVGITALVVLFAGARFAPRVPWGLLVLVGAVLASQWLDLEGRGVAVVGTVPDGLPPVGLPGVGVGDLLPLLAGGLALTMVGLGEGLSAARIFSARQRTPVDTDQEFLASGAANIAAGLSSGLAVAGSLSKTAAAQRAGARTQVYGLVSALVVIVVLLVAASLLYALPKAVLSAIVIQAVWGLLDVGAIRRYARVRRNDFVSAVAAALGVLVLGPLYGLLTAIVQSVLGVVYRSSRVDIDVMGRIPSEKAAWGNVSRHPERAEVDGLLVLRLDAPLFWANAVEIHDRVLAEVDERPGLAALLLDLEASNQLDTTSVDMLQSLLGELRVRGVELYLVRVLGRVRDVLARSGFLDDLEPGRLWHSISQGVKAARKELDLKHWHPPDETAPEEDEEEVSPDLERIAVDPHDDDPP